MSNEDATANRLTNNRGVTRQRGGSRGVGGPGTPSGSGGQPPPGRPPRPGPADWPKRSSEIGSLIHRLVLRVLHVRLTAIGLPNDFEIPVPRGSKRLRSNYRGYVDLATFMPDHNPRKPGSDIAHLYELKPNDPAKFPDYVAEVDHYTEYFPQVYRPTRPSTMGRGRFISSARIGQTLRPLFTIAPLLFEPIVIEARIFSVIIRFWPPRGFDGLIVYEWAITPKHPGQQGVMERRMNSTIPRLQVSPEIVQRISRHNTIAVSYVVCAVVGGTIIAVGLTAGMAGAASSAVVGAVVVAETASAGTAAAVGAGAVTVAGLMRVATPVANDIARAAAAVIIALGGTVADKPNDRR